MSKLDEFKGFVKQHPELVKHVNDGSMNWQRFYEMYDMYGSENDAWKDYIPTATAVNTAALAAGGLSLAGVLNWIKNINLDQVQNGVNSLQRVLGVVQDLGVKNDSEKKTTDDEYKPRPLYKHFED